MIARAGRVSVPGEPPAPDTGALRGSIQTEYDNTLQKGRVGTNKVYAAPLNFGTMRAGPRRNIVIRPRPFMEPALKKAQVAMAAAGIRELRLRPIVRAR
jgi:phage gpG-like protein